MLDEAAPDVVYVAVPPHRSVAVGERLVERGIPFLVEKPLAASDADGPARLADAIDRAGLVVAVGYHLRALDIMAEVRERLAADPPRLVVARWLDRTPPPAWWGRVDEGGGQVVEQATHLYDLARLILGEAVVVGAARRATRQARHPRSTSPTRRRRCSASTAGPSARSPTAAGSPRRSSRSSSCRTGCSRRWRSVPTAARATGTPASTTARPSGRSGPRPTRTSARPRPSSTRSRPAIATASCRPTATRWRPTG